MNAKQAAPLIVTLPTLVELAAAAPPLIVVGAICVGGYFLLNWLFPDGDKDQKPESMPASATPASAARPALVIPSISGGNSGQNRSIPANSGGKPNWTPAPAIVRVSSAPVTPEIPVKPTIVPIHSAPVPTPQKVAAQIPPPPNKKKFVRREDLAAVFQRGARALTRTAAVAALKKIGFGKSAAYEALSVNGRFSDWLQFAQDGIITWTG
jgi:hypothetical protein